MHQQLLEPTCCKKQISREQRGAPNIARLSGMVISESQALARHSSGAVIFWGPTQGTCRAQSQAHNVPCLPQQVQGTLVTVPGYGLVSLPSIGIRLTLIEVLLSGNLVGFMEPLSGLFERTRTFYLEQRVLDHVRAARIVVLACA